MIVFFPVALMVSVEPCDYPLMVNSAIIYISGYVENPWMGMNTSTPQELYLTRFDYIFIRKNMYSWWRHNRNAPDTSLVLWSH